MALTAVAAFAVWAAAASPAVAASAAVTRLSDRAHKTDLLAGLGYAPRLVFFGGSRSLRIPPAYAWQAAGLRTFNYAVQESTTEDVWAFTHHLVRRGSGGPLYVVWGLQPNIFSDRTLDVALVRDSRLNRYFPLSLRQSMGGGEPHTWANRAFARDGHVVWDNYDRFERAGRTLEKSLSDYIAQALRKRSDGDVIPAHETRAKRYFEATLAYMNAHDCEPLLLIMPVHPRVIRAVRDERWDTRRANFLAYLKSLQTSYRFSILDFTFISRFGGSASLFYDGVHMKEENSRRLLKAAMERAPWAFGLAPAPWDVLHDQGEPESASPSPSQSGSPFPSASPTLVG